MKALCPSCSSGLTSLFRGALSTTRNQNILPGKLFFCHAKFVPPTLLAAEKEEAKSVLTLFLKRQGLSKAVAARTVNKSDLFIDHLVSRLHSVHKSRYLVGGELNTREIRDTLIPYLESLLEKHGNILLDLVENFSNAPTKEKPAAPVSQPCSSLESKKTKAISVAPVKEKPAASVSLYHSILNSKKPKAFSQVSDAVPVGDVRPKVLYLIGLGLDLERIKVITRRYPDFAYCSLERKMKPLVEFLLDLGVPKSDIPRILSQRPQLCQLSLSENLIPSMLFLENLGVNKKKWAKIIYRYPGLLTRSKQKVQAIVNFLSELGFSSECIGKILTRWPNIVAYSVEDNLRPTVEYFHSLGVDVSILLRRCPLTLGLSIEGHLKPVTEFFLKQGFSIEEFGTMISRFGPLYTCSLTKNLIPKWEFFLTMDYSKSELVKFPVYFGCSLEGKIRPRYALVKQSGVKMGLNQLLALPGPAFEKVLNRKMKKKRSGKGLSGRQIRN